MLESPISGRPVTGSSHDGPGTGLPTFPAPGDTADDARRLLRQYGVSGQLEPQALLRSIAEIFNHWTLTDEQHRHLLVQILTCEDIQVLNCDIDALGREVLRLGVEERGYRPGGAILVSMRTHRIVGYELVRRVRRYSRPRLLEFRLWGWS